MKVSRVKQLSPEWFQLKKGRIGGKRFGQVISGRKNKLIYELLNERLSDFIIPDEFVNDDIQFGIDNEDAAAKLYSKSVGIRFGKVGAILSDTSDIHLASPDRLNRRKGIVLEIKCTQDGATQIQRYFEGIPSEYWPQVINYFAVSDDVKEVHWVSYCPSRTERPIVAHVVTLNSFVQDGKDRVPITQVISTGRHKIKEIEKALIEMEHKFKF